MIIALSKRSVLCDSPQLVRLRLHNDVNPTLFSLSTDLEQSARARDSTTKKEKSKIKTFRVTKKECMTLRKTVMRMKFLQSQNGRLMKFPLLKKRN